MPVVDAHQHLWDVERIHYAWYREGGGAACHTFVGDDLAPLISDAEIDATILVQGADLTEDTAFLLEEAHRHPWVAGVVGWIPLKGARAATDALERLADEPNLCGVRHAIFYEPDPDWLLRRDVMEGLGVLAAHQIPFDVGAVLPRHLEHVSTIARRYPELPLVVDHLGRPPIRQRAWEPWLSLLRVAAGYPNVYAKISGLMTAAHPERWSIADLQPYIEAAIEAFTPQRLMYGSDWPVCLEAVGYCEALGAIRAAVAGLSATDRGAIFGETAVACYGLALSRM